MRKIEVVLSDERLITPSGLCMVGQAMAKSDLIKKAARMKTEKRSQPQIKNGDILLTEIGMLTLGKTDFDYPESAKLKVLQTQKYFYFTLIS